MDTQYLIVEGDFPFWRGFVVEDWKRLPVRTLNAQPGAKAMAPP